MPSTEVATTATTSVRSSTPHDPDHVVAVLVQQLNTAIHRIAVTQMRIHQPAKDYLERRIGMRNTKTEALRALKRRLSDVVFRALLADADTIGSAALEQAA